MSKNCEECNKPVSEKVETFSTKKYNKILCMDCQKKVSPAYQKENNIIETETVRSCDKDELILRQVALKASVELAKCPEFRIQKVEDVIKVAELLNDWLNK